MSSHVYHTSRPDSWVHPRSYTDASLRRRKYGRVRPMEEPPGFWARLMGFR
ncbi:hypothetical protein [Altererythrobacter sp. MF3-039]|uniref:hypothetical protein n=1 Tax=Altererythrobacter sp. MF3-039 TaxID=3252901 RepID=UPI00390C82C8